MIATIRRAVLLLAVVACGGTAVTTTAPTSSTATASPVATTSSPPATSLPLPTTTSTLPTTTVPVNAAPDWLGTRILPLRPDGHGEALPTPPELVDRRFTLPDLFPPPPDGEYRSTIGPVPAEVAARSSWTDDCPVDLSELRYLTLSFWGFDDRPHTGEMIVNAAAAADIAEVFGALFEARFPLEEMRVVTAAEVDLPPTGDWNDTTSFVCRPVPDSSNWSMHAYGLAVDVNPFHNPYLKGDLVLPELASAYLDRDRALPGMIAAGDAVTTAFAAIGWGWGGEWTSLVDYMHFSSNGR